MDVTESGLKLVEVAKGYTVEDVVNSTEATLIVDENVVVRSLLIQVMAGCL